MLLKSVNFSQKNSHKIIIIFQLFCLKLLLETSGANCKIASLFKNMSHVQVNTFKYSNVAVTSNKMFLEL